MARAKLDPHDDGSEGVLFLCPGCGCLHGPTVKRVAQTGPQWGWNGSLDAPTFTPSILVRGTAFTEKGKAEYQAWVDAGCQPRLDRIKPEAFDHVETVCHFFVTDGRIQFLGDCTHPLAGQTVDLPTTEEW